MTPLTGIVHPRLYEKLADWAPLKCTIRESLTETIDDHGHATKTYTDVPGLVDIDCQLKPARADEVRTTDLVVGHNAFRAALLGYHPTITTAMQAVVDGTTYNILGVEHDSQHALTYLTVEKVTL